MSKTSTGVVLRTPSGKFIRAYKSHTHTGEHTYIQETPDIDSATVFYPDFMNNRLRKRAEHEHPDTTVLEVTITRTVTITCEGKQPCLL